VGPSIITEHRIGDASFYILFSHLRPNALDNLKEGATVRSGDQIASVATEVESVELPPHVHLQLITDLGEHSVDFPEVARLSEKNKYMNVCANPESLLSPFMVKDC